MFAVVHSKGVNNELVENLLLDLDRKSKGILGKATDLSTRGLDLILGPEWLETLSEMRLYWRMTMGFEKDAEAISLEKSTVWVTDGEVAEFLLPSIFVNITARKDLDIDLHRLICLQLKEHIFTESNKLMKSIQVVLNCLNELRMRHVMERSSFVPSKREVSKNSRPSSYSSKTRSTPAKARESAVVSNAFAMSPSSWEKVYWISIDYLLIAKFAALPDHIEILVSAVTRINEPDSLYGILQSHKLTSQIITFEHEGNWGKALEYYDLQVQSDNTVQKDGSSRSLPLKQTGSAHPSSFASEANEMRQSRPYKGLIRSLQQIGCTHVLDMYCRGLTSSKDQHQHDLEFTELQFESAWRAGKWDFSLPCVGTNLSLTSNIKCDHFNENLHSCLRALNEGDRSDFDRKLRDTKQDLVLSVSHASEESTEYIYLTIIKLQGLIHFLCRVSEVGDLLTLIDYKDGLTIPYKALDPSLGFLLILGLPSPIIDHAQEAKLMLYHLGMAWDLRWRTCQDNSTKFSLQKPNFSSEPLTPSIEQGGRFSQAASALQEFKLLSVQNKGQSSSLYWLGRLEEAKLFRAQGQNVTAINLAMYISQNYHSNEEASDAFRLIGKWLAETRSSNSRTILEKYLKPAVSIAEDVTVTAKNSMERKCQTHFHLAHYADALFRSHEERLNSNEWQAAMRLRKHKTVELEELIKRGEKTDYSMKIQELQKQVAMDKEEAQKLQDDRDNFLSLALEGYKRCLVIHDKYDVRVWLRKRGKKYLHSIQNNRICTLASDETILDQEECESTFGKEYRPSKLRRSHSIVVNLRLTMKQVFRIVSLWFSLSSRKDVVNSMLSTIDEVQSFKFIPLVYQIASRMGNSKDGHGNLNFQFALVSLVKKMAIDHPYHTILQLLALANGDRIRDKQRSRSSFVVDMDKKLAAENLLNELSSYHGAIIQQMKQMVEIYIRLAELETKREVPVVTATISIDRSCQYHEGTFPYFKGLADSVMIMNGINAPKVVECLGSNGCRYRQLAKSGNDDLRQDAVMEQFFGLVNTFLRNHQDTCKRRLGVRTYKVVPFTPSAGVLEWVNGTLPLGEYLIGSMRNGGAHGRYGIGDWAFLKCREHMANPAEWFEKRLAYTRSVAASSMVGYIVGLGDRHSMNILIDQATAEVVHIDLGVAFEQGLMLKTPERVPFRLTRDIIDGMGVTGVEGVFRRCCEETLSVMRTNKEALLTIVEVFIHDPLYKWALSPLKALQRQKVRCLQDLDDDFDTSLEEPQNDYQGNKDATRALLRVKQKLDGYEEGEMRSIHGQVQQLIQDAIDSERLCQMFPGWGAWLTRVGGSHRSNMGGKLPKVSSMGGNSIRYGGWHH
ncbi:unnamed protein product [Sphenostylis stenocarpa]|uniref:Serine/threonine-protein kinase ATM n=1 Tax=Sphenostylis stenocarpa TaxID=92480 RepID=A0AA86TQ95_9FABA|nr:unnamed protein product [Sphenostylis stenocarpa]